jgi:hypothetical protein
MGRFAGALVYGQPLGAAITLKKCHFPPMKHAVDGRTD